MTFERAAHDALMAKLDRIERKLDAEAAGREKLRDRLDRISGKLDTIREEMR